MAAEDFIPNQPLPSVAKPQMVLGAFGLKLLKPRFYKQGTGLNLSNKDSELSPTINKGVLGLPVFGGITLKAGSYIDKNGGVVNYGDGGRIGLGLILDCCLIEVGMQRQIVSTQIQGRSGTIKQFISNGDYAITIKGVISSSIPDVYPDTDMRVLQSFCNAEDAISITCPYLEDFFQVSSLVVQYASFPQLEGNITVQPFELKCLSDEPVILKTKDA